MVANKPKQLEIIRERHYNRMSSKNPLLAEKLKPFMKKAEIIEETEPSLSSPNDPLSKRLQEPEISNGLDKKSTFMKSLNKFSTEQKKSKKVNLKRITKLSDIKPEVLHGLQ